MSWSLLDDSETERLAWLAEECGEVIHIIGKILRHGYDASHPDGGPDNRALLEEELSDVKNAIWLMNKAGDINIDMTQASQHISKYLYHQDHLLF